MKNTRKKENILNIFFIFDKIASSRRIVMKKAVCILLCFTILFSFAACNVKKVTDENTSSLQTTTDPYRLEIVKDKKVSKEFTAADGTVSYVVEATLPEIFGGCSEGVAAAINKHYTDLYDEALAFAELNVENAATYMKNLGSQKPWTRTISYEVSFCNKEYLCLTVLDSMPLSAGPNVTTDCIKLTDGIECELSAFFAEGVQELSDSSLDMINSAFIDLATDELGTKLTQEQLDAIDANFDPNRFYFDENNIYFIISKGKIDFSIASEGLFVAEFTWDDFGGELESPTA